MKVIFFGKKVYSSIRYVVAHSPLKFYCSIRYFYIDAEKIIGGIEKFTPPWLHQQQNLASFPGVTWASFFQNLPNNLKYDERRCLVFRKVREIQKRLSPMGIYAASLRSWAYSVSRKICFFSACRKIKRLISIILVFQRIPTESHSCGLKWDLSAPRKNRIFSHISSNLAEDRSVFILSHMSEILSEFAHFEVWWR